MRTIQSILLIVFVLFSTNIVSAQFGNNGMGGNGMNQRGLNQMGNNMPQSEPEKPKEIPAEVTTALIMEEMKPVLVLDELQVIAISNVLTESIKTQGVLLKQEYSQEDQMKNFQALAETTDRKINQFLSQEQKEKYLVFKEDRKKPKKKESKKKQK